MRLSGRWPGNKAIGTHIIYSESEEATASSASMLGMLMGSMHDHGSIPILVGIPIVAKQFGA